MPYGAWVRDTADVFCKKLEGIESDVATAVLVHYHADTQRSLAERMENVTMARLRKLATKCGIVVPSGTKDVLIRRKIEAHIAAHAIAYPQLVRSLAITSTATRIRENEAKEEEEKREASEGDVSDEPTTPPPRTSTGAPPTPRASPRTSKGIRKDLAPAVSKSTASCSLALPSARTASTVLNSSDILRALALIPKRAESSAEESDYHRRRSERVKHDKKARSKSDKKESSHRSDNSSSSDATDSDSDGPSIHRSAGRETRKAQRDEGGKEKRSRRKSSPHHRRVASPDYSSSSDDSSSRLLTDRRVIDKMDSMGVKRPMYRDFLENVRSKYNSVHHGFENTPFKSMRNEKECKSLALALDLLEEKRISEAKELLARRFVGVHLADQSGGDWDLCASVELDMSKQSFVSDHFLASILKSASRISALQGDSKPKSKRASKPSQQPRGHQYRSPSPSRDPPAKSSSTKSKSNPKQHGQSGSRKK